MSMTSQMLEKRLVEVLDEKFTALISALDRNRQQLEKIADALARKTPARPMRPRPRS